MRLWSIQQSKREQKKNCLLRIVYTQAVFLGNSNICISNYITSLDNDQCFFVVTYSVCCRVWVCFSTSPPFETIIVILFDFNRSVLFVLYFFFRFRFGVECSVWLSYFILLSFAFFSTVFASFACVLCALYLVAFIFQNFHTVS